MSGAGAALLSVLMLAALALIAGGIRLVATNRDRGKGALMLIAAAVLIANVLVWSL